MTAKTIDPKELTNRKGDYGFDAPYVPAGFILGGILSVGLSFIGGFGWLVTASFFFLMAASFIYATRSGKLAVWAELIAALPLTGSEKILDVGCGRGVVLLACAKRLSTGKAVGLDLWRSMDQSGNDPETTRTNATIEGVIDRVELITSDMCNMPFPDASMDYVVSNAAIHNVPTAEGRDKAVKEIVRVLKPGGRVLIGDFRFGKAYMKSLTDAGLNNVAQRSLGWRMWYGGPWASCFVIEATKSPA